MKTSYILIGVLVLYLFNKAKEKSKTEFANLRLKKPINVADITNGNGTPIISGNNTLLQNNLHYIKFKK